MPIAMACVAARRRDGVAMAFTAGDVGLAVQASAAIEGRFAPVRIRGEQYVDADWSTPLPVRVARALGELKAAGLAVYAITGRPVGWSLPFVHGTQPWPVDAIVAENGAVALWRGASGELCRDYLQDAATRATLAGKIVLVGSSAQGLMDLRFNPLGRVMPGPACRLPSASDGSPPDCAVLRKLRKLRTASTQISTHGWYAFGCVLAAGSH